MRDDFSGRPATLGDGNIDVGVEIQYFLDPFKVISQYRSCKLNKSKSFIESYSLGVV